MESLGHFHKTRTQAFACAKMASAPKKPRQTLLSTFFHSSSSEQNKGKDLFIYFRVCYKHFEKNLDIYVILTLKS